MGFQKIKKGQLPTLNVLITMHTGLRPLGTLIYDPTIRVEGNRFLFTGILPWGLLRALLLRALSPTGSRSFLAPQKATSQNDGQISPISLSVIKLVTQMDLHHL